MKNQNLQLKVFNSDWEMENAVTVKIFFEDIGKQPGVMVRSPNPGVSLVPYSTDKRAWYYLGLEQYISAIFQIFLGAIIAGGYIWFREFKWKNREIIALSMVKYMAQGDDDKFTRDEVLMMTNMAIKSIKTCYFPRDEYPRIAIDNIRKVLANDNKDANGPKASA